MASNFYCWTLNRGTNSACTYYRIDVPFSQLQALDLANVFMDNGKTKDSDVARMHADIAHFYSLGGERFLHEIATMRKMQPAIRQDRELYPPTLIYDVDDCNDFTHPFNPAFVGLGVRDYPAGNLLKPGEGLEIRSSTDDFMAEWSDQETHCDGQVFDVARNLHQMKIRHEIARTCHGGTFASEALAKYFKDVVGMKNTYFFPNTIVPKEFDSIRAVRTDDSVRILWQGGVSHFVDWYPLRDALAEICKLYPNVKFVIFGEYFKWIHDVIPGHMVEHHAWVDYSAYKLKRGLLNIDINLAPLANNVFNVCKSAIKWYEASVWEIPEATLAANVGPYKEIKDGETGLLYNSPAEFVTKLGLLIQDAGLRARLGAGARAWVLQNRTPEATIPGLYDFYTETRARQRRDLGKPIIKAPTLDQIKKVGTILR